jgi:heat shock protein HtpX
LLGSWIPVLAIAAALLGVQYWFSDQIALSAMRAIVVGPEEEPRLYAVFTRLCARVDIPKPALAVADTDDVPGGAFATGRTPSRAVLCVAAGLTEQLTDDELETVLARELSRLAHRDLVVITLATLMPVLAGLLIRVPFHTAPLGGPGWQTSPTLGVELIALVLSVYALGFLLVRALSRYRELAADRGGAVLTGRPSALARALVKLDSTGTPIPAEDLRTPATPGAFTISLAGGPRSRALFSFSSHPSLQARLDRLAGLAATPGGPGRDRAEPSDR